MNLPDIFRDNAEDCAFLADARGDETVKRALAAWKMRGERWRQNRSLLITKIGQQKTAQARRLIL